MSYGATPFGMGPFGASSGSISISRAWATSTRTVRVTVSSPARAADSFDAGDALNPATWQVGRLDTGQDYTPIGVRHLGGLVAFEVTVLEDFGSHEVTHRIASSTLLGAGGALITAPYQATFPGVVDATDPIRIARRRPMVRDLANPFRANPMTGDTLLAIQASGGDYRAEVDAAVIYKALIRRLTTERGSHRDLPNYGVGFTSKALVPQGGDLDALRVEVERQALREPGVKKVRVAISIPGRGVVITRVVAGIVNGQLTFAVRRNSDGTFAQV